MRISQKQLFDISWRFSILALPWQTRWFSQASLGGWPWEQGSWSVYASWPFLLATIVLGWGLVRRASQKVATPKHYSSITFCLAVAFFVSSIVPLFQPDWRIKFPAIAQWWAQVILLAAFVWTLRRCRVAPLCIARWCVLALLPHAMLGLWQYGTQRVFAASWFGMSAQDPRELGVSVVEAGDLRVLRAHGGFPHPNIFGGWLSIGVFLATVCASAAKTKLRAAAWSIAAATLSLALLLTYARGAWIATIIGIGCLILWITRTRVTLQHTSASLQYACVALLASIVLLSPIVWMQRDVILARARITDRLEKKSIVTRSQSLADGWRLLQTHRWFGTGPNAELVVLANTSPRQDESSPRREPLESPHSVYLLAMLNVGIVGSIFLCMLIVTRAWFYHSLGWSPQSISILFIIATLGLFDKYLWSFWAGQALIAIACALASNVSTRKSQTS